MSTEAGAPNGAVNPESGAATTGASTSYDKGDIEARLRHEPDFAVEQHKANQREITRLKELEKQTAALAPLVNAANVVSPGDLATGVNQILGLVESGYRVEQDPKLKQLVANYQPGSVSQESDMDNGDEFLTPEEKALKERAIQLEGQVQALQARLDMQGKQVASTALTSHLDAFFQGEVGQRLTQEERADVLQGLKTQAMQWASTAAGQEQLSKMTADTVDMLAHNHLRTKGVLKDVYARMSTQNKGVLGAPDGPGIPTLQSEPELDPNASVLDAFTAAIQRYAPEASG